MLRRFRAGKNGPAADQSYFPIAVWLQDPSNALRYQAASINLYIGLWKGPTEVQLDALEKARMPVICEQNATGLKNKENASIVGWMHGDEPDNAQAIPGGRGYGPPILPETIVQDYERIRAADPSRPVLLNLGQGVAWDDYVGRGVRRAHPEDYARYVKGCDIVSFDIYPVVHFFRSVEVAASTSGHVIKPRWPDNMNRGSMCRQESAFSSRIKSSNPGPTQPKPGVFAVGAPAFSRQFQTK